MINVTNNAVLSIYQKNLKKIFSALFSINNNNNNNNNNINNVFLQKIRILEGFQKDRVTGVMMLKIQL